MLPKLIILFFILPVIGLGQSTTQSKSYSADPSIEYRNWSIILGPVIYNKATLTPQYGEYSFVNKPILGYNAGFEYDFYHIEKWTLTTGFIWSKEPVYNLEYVLKEEDIYSHFNGDLYDYSKMYAMLSFSFPLYVKRNFQVARNLYLQPFTGLKVKYFPAGSATLSVNIYNEDQSESREVFGLRLESPDNYIQYAYAIGIGSSYGMKKVLIKANIIYSINFQTLISGEYMFGNLLVSPESRGYYELSGNYLGLLFSFNLKKGKLRN